MGYRNETYRLVMEELARRRTTADTEAEAHRTDLYMRSPDARELDAALARTGMRIFEAAVSGQDVENKIAAIRRENEEMLAARRELLASLGLPTDYTDPHYVCAKCADTGYIMTTMCDCCRDLLRVEGFRQSGLGAQIDRQTFDNFSLDYYRTSDEYYRRMAQNLAVAKEFALHFAPGKENLLLLGGTGLGKTHLSTAIARAVIEGGHDVVYESVQTVFADFEYDRFRNGYSNERGRAERYMTAELLILDDLGAEFGNQFTVSCLYQLINTREVKGLSTIVSTNLTAQELMERYDGRLTSRFLGNYRILQFVGKDARLQNILKN